MLSIRHQSVCPLSSLFFPVRGNSLQTLFMGWDRRKNKPVRSANGAMSPAVDQTIVWGRTRNPCRSRHLLFDIEPKSHLHRRAFLWPGNLTERCISHLQPYAIVCMNQKKVPRTLCCNLPITIAVSLFGKPLRSHGLPSGKRGGICTETRQYLSILFQASSSQEHKFCSGGDRGGWSDNRPIATESPPHRCRDTLAGAISFSSQVPEEVRGFRGIALPSNAGPARHVWVNHPRQ